MAGDSSGNDVSGSARMSFTQFLRKGAPNRSSSHEHDSRGTANLLCSPNAAAHAAFSSGNSSLLVAHNSQEESRLSNSGGEPRVSHSPLQTQPTGKRRAKTFPRDLKASVSRDGAVEPRTIQVKLGGAAPQENFTHSPSHLVNELEGGPKVAGDLTTSHIGTGL